MCLQKFLIEQPIISVYEDKKMILSHETTIEKYFSRKWLIYFFYYFYLIYLINVF
jgi:hypothetical protein